MVQRGYEEIEMEHAHASLPLHHGPNIGDSPHQDEAIPVLAVESKVLARDECLKALVKYRSNKHGYKGVFFYL